MTRESPGPYDIRSNNPLQCLRGQRGPNAKGATNVTATLLRFEAAEADRLALLDHVAPWDDQYVEGPTCPICDGLGHGYPGAGPCPIESPDPLYYADEMAAGR